MAFVVVTGQVFSDNTGASKEMPVLLSPGGPIVPLIDYFLTKRRSLAWQEKVIRSAKLFLEYLEKNMIQEEEEWRLFRNFANALRHGTMNSRTGDDPSGLYWQPVGVHTSNRSIALLSDLFDWLGRDDNPRSRKFNPRYQGNQYDRHIEHKAFLYRRDNAFLGHTWIGDPPRLPRVTSGERPPKVHGVRPPAFPEDRIEELLFKGFKVAGKQNFRDMAITCLLLGGGLRGCEPFHLYLADVQPHWDDPSVAFVAIHHPSEGLAPNDWKNSEGKRGTRAEYLSSVYGLVPRHEIRGKLRAGWKNPALDQRWFMQVHWFPKMKYGTLFLDIWRRYLEQIAAVERHHPYAWINLSRGDTGGIYKVSCYLKSLQGAVERIGLTYGKQFGTSSHGPRHAYGQRARRSGINEIILQRIMHHCSPESQLVYTQPELGEVTAALERAAEKVTSSAVPPHEQWTNLIEDE